MIAPDEKVTIRSPIFNAHVCSGMKPEKMSGNGSLKINWLRETCGRNDSFRLEMTGFKFK
jgi:hypothetical protein